MARAATDVMQSIIFSAVLDAVEALKAGSRGLPNQMLRDIQAIHPNITFADLPKALQSAIAASTRSAFTQLLREGYAVGPKTEQRQSRPIDRVPERQRTGERRPGDRRATDRRPGKGPGGSDRPGKGPDGPRPRGPKGKPRPS